MLLVLGGAGYIGLGLDRKLLESRAKDTPSRRWNMLPIPV